MIISQSQILLLVLNVLLSQYYVLFYFFLLYYLSILICCYKILYAIFILDINCSMDYWIVFRFSLFICFVRLFLIVLNCCKWLKAENIELVFRCLGLAIADIHVFYHSSYGLGLAEVIIDFQLLNVIDYVGIHSYLLGLKVVLIIILPILFRHLSSCIKLEILDFGIRLTLQAFIVGSLTIFPLILNRCHRRLKLVRSLPCFFRFLISCHTHGIFACV